MYQKNICKKTDELSAFQLFIINILKN